MASYIDRIFKDVFSVDEIFNRYKPRNLKEGAKVVRVAPSPTGFMHLGGIYAGLINYMLAIQSGGVMFLRIEDTDTKREVDGAVELICSSLNKYKINVDEGFNKDTKEFGTYGPYKQSDRKKIYHSFIKQMLIDGLAYPCFATPEELENIRKTQETQAIRPGYYGKWAVWRNATEEQINAELDKNIPVAIRFKSNGNYENKITINDGLKGKINFPENDLDIVICKADGLPTYHFAHVIDDFLMGTTHVIRGDEWLNSLPLHVQLFKTLGFKLPKYIHISPLQKMDGGSRRKLSKRHDKEADIRFFDREGYPEDAVIEYLLNLANSNFESWRLNNPNKPWQEFELQISKLSPSGALFDFNKLDNISKNIIAAMTKEELFDNVFCWAETNDTKLYEIMKNNKEYVINIFGIERGLKNSRKDIAKYSDVWGEIKYFFDDEFNVEQSVIQELKAVNNYKEIAKKYIEILDTNKNQQDWFIDMQNLAIEFNFATNGKEFKENPDKYNGTITDFIKLFRIMITGKINSPDISQIQKVMGDNRVKNKIEKFISGDYDK